MRGIFTINAFISGRRSVASFTPSASIAARVPASADFHRCAQLLKAMIFEKFASRGIAAAASAVIVSAPASLGATCGAGVVATATGSSEGDACGVCAVEIRGADSGVVGQK